MAETRTTRKAAPVGTRAPAKKAVAVKKTPVKKAVVKKAAPATRAPAKAAAKKATNRAPARKAVAKPTPAVLVTSTPDPIDSITIAPAAAPTRRFSTRAIAIAAVAAVAVLATGGGVFAATRDHGPSKEKFIATADALCRPANGPVTAIVKPTNYPELATAAGTVASTTTAQLTQLTALKRPHGADGKAFEPTLKAFTATNAAAKALQDAAAKKDDVATIAATKQMTAQFTDAANQAKTYGLAACAAGMQSGIDNVNGGSQSVLKAGFTAKADSLCRASARKSDSIPEPVETPASLAQYLTANLEVFNKLLADLKALPVPPGDEAAVAEMFAAADKVNAKIGEGRDAIAASDLARITAVDKEISTLSTAADAKFDAYGLGVCGSNFGD